MGPIEKIMKTSKFKSQYKRYSKKQLSKPIPCDPLEKHNLHTVKIVLSNNGTHYAKYHCVDCNKFVAWLSRKQTNQALELGMVK